MDSDYYGGAGYAGDKSRPDLSNTAFFLEALKTAGAPQGRSGVQEGTRVRQPLPELQERVQHGRVGREEQRRQLHLHRSQRRRESPLRWRNQDRHGRLRQHDLRRHQEHDLLRRRQGRPTHEEGARTGSRRTTRSTANPGMPGDELRNAACTTTTTPSPRRWTRWASINSRTPRA